jgi:two-component system response regulator CiaR
MDIDTKLEVELMIKILVVEDEMELSKSEVELLSEFAEVTAVFDGEEALFEAETGIYDLIVLDWMLPQMSGIDVLQKLRKEKNMTPVLFLTAKDDIEDKMKGFEYGADDYLTKPFYMEELKMRAQSLLRRSGALTNVDEISYFDVSLRLSDRSVLHNGQTLNIQGKEFDLLLYFIQNQGVILTKEQIFDRLWGFDSETAITVVEVYMSKLRKNLSGTEVKEKIKTLRNVGYILEKEEE